MRTSRYAVCIERELWDSDGESTNAAEYVTFDTLTEIARFMYKNGVNLVHVDGEWNAQTTVQSDRTEFYISGVRDYVLTPVLVAEQITVTPEHGITDRMWCQVILSVQERFKKGSATT